MTTQPSASHSTLKLPVAHIIRKKSPDGAFATTRGMLPGFAFHELQPLSSAAIIFEGCVARPTSTRIFVVFRLICFILLVSFKFVCH